MDYLDHFARFKRKENVEAVERLLSSHKELAKFERAQLGTGFDLLLLPSLHQLLHIYLAVLSSIHEISIHHFLNL
jgi:RNA polymerase Rpb4